MKFLSLFLITVAVGIAQISNVSTKTNSYTATVDDRNRLLVFSGRMPPLVTLTIPFETTNSRTNFSTGSIIYGLALTDSTVLIQGQPGVTITSADNAFRSRAFGSEWQLKRLGRNLWTLSGDLYSVQITAYVGDSIIIKAIADSDASGPFLFKWYKNNVFIPGATNASLKLNDVKLTDAGNYRAEVSNAAGLFRSETTNLLVK